jgi:hypothetical protein
MAWQNKYEQINQTEDYQNNLETFCRNIIYIDYINELKQEQMNLYLHTLPQPCEAFTGDDGSISIERASVTMFDPPTSRHRLHA